MKTIYVVTFYGPFSNKERKKYEELITIALFRVCSVFSILISFLLRSYSLLLRRPFRRSFFRCNHHHRDRLLRLLGDLDDVLDLSDLENTFKNLPDLSGFNISSLHVSPAVDSVCSGTDYAAECVVSILPLLRDFRRFEPKPVDVLRMEMSALYEKANATLELAKRLVVDQSTPRDVADVLELCVDNYESLLGDLDDASVAVGDEDFGRLESVVSAAIADVVTCSDAFAESTELVSPMANVDAFLKKLCSNVLAISQMIYM